MSSKAEDQRTRLIDAAAGVLAWEGVHAASARRIVDDAGLSLGVLHYCFPNRAALLHAAVERLVDADGPVSR